MRIHRRGLIAVLAALLLTVLAGCGAPEAEQSPLVVLFTDSSAGDYFAAQTHGQILSRYAAARVVDGAVGMPAYDLTSAGTVIALGSQPWPQGTIFICIVNPGDIPGAECLVARSTDGHLFLAPDNGVLTPVAQDPGLEAVYRIDNQELFTTPLAESEADVVMAEAAALLASGTPPEQLGPAVEQITEIEIPEPSRTGATLKGTVVLVTSFGDCLTNVSAALVAQAGLVAGDQLVVSWAAGRVAMPLAHSWSDVPAGKPLAVLEPGAPLKLGVNQGDFAASYGLAAGTRVTVRASRAEARRRPAALAAAQRAVQSSLDALDKDLSAAAEQLRGKALNGIAARSLLNDLAGRHPEVMGFATVGTGGVVLAVAPEQYRSYEGRALSNARAASRLRRSLPVLTPPFAAPDHSPAVALLHPVRGKDDAVAGAIGCAISTADFLGGLVAPLVKGPEVDSIWVVDTRGEVLYDPDPAQVGANVLTDPMFAPYPEVVDMVAEVIRRPSGYGTYSFPAEGATGQAVQQDVTWVNAGLYGVAWRIAATKVAGDGQ